MAGHPHRRCRRWARYQRAQRRCRTQVLKLGAGRSWLMVRESFGISAETEDSAAEAEIVSQLNRVMHEGVERVDWPADDAASEIISGLIECLAEGELDEFLVSDYSSMERRWTYLVTHKLSIDRVYQDWRVASEARRTGVGEALKRVRACHRAPPTN